MPSILRTPHLTDGYPPEETRQHRQSVPGMAFFAATGPLGTCCGECTFFGCGDQLKYSPWLSDAHELVNLMRGIRCTPGSTQIARTLRHIKAENTREKIGAAVFVGDAVEELPVELYTAAADLNTPLFCFQEGDGLAVYLDEHGGIVQERPPVKVEQVFRELARITGGAYGKFDAGAAGRLGDLLRAVAAFAVGGVKALANQQTDSARKLLAQMK